MSPRSRQPLSTRTAAILLAALCVAAFWRVVATKFQIYDDPGYVSENPMVLGGLTFRGIVWAFSTGTEANWHPLTWLSHMVDIELFGLNPLYHHAMNVLLQALAAITLYMVLVRLTKSVGRSLFVAAVFAVHPLQVESVAWIAERKDVLSGALGMLTLLAYARYVERPDIRRYAAVSGGLLLGLLAKPSLIVLPALFLLIDYWPMQRFPGASSAWQLVREKIPWFALSLLSGIVTWIVQEQGGAMTFAETLPVEARLGNAAISFAKYLGKSFWPSGLAVLYPHPGTALPLLPLVGSIALLAGITVAAVRWRRRAPYLITGWFWYLVALLPVIGIAQVGLQAMADRYMHIPIIGLAIIGAWGMTDLAGRVKIQPWTRTFLGGGVIGLLTVTTLVQTGYWENSVTLFQRAVDVTDRNWVAYNNLGVALEGSMRYREARAHYREALRLNPDYIEASINLANGLMNDAQAESAEAVLRRSVARNPRNVDLRTNLGAMLVKRGRADEALREYGRAFAEDSSRSEILHHMAQIAADAGLLSVAESVSFKFLRKNPDSSEVHDLLGTIQAQQGKIGQAYGEFREALRLDSENVSAAYNLGLLSERMGTPDSAMIWYNAALRHDPTFWNAHQSLGTLYARKGDLSAALGHFSAVVRLKPGFADGHNNLGKVFELQGKTESAMAQFTQALAIDSGHVQAHYNMGVLLARAGDNAKAAEHLRAALAREPALAEAKALLQQLGTKGGRP